METPLSVRHFLASGPTRKRGRAAEDVAARWLTGEGYAIVARNVSSRYGELDLVALDGETLCFVEIKARGTPGFGPAVAAVTPDKQRRIARAAAAYLSRNPHDGPCRFDVLGMDARGDEWRFTLVRDAFLAD